MWCQTSPLTKKISRVFLKFQTCEDKLLKLSVKMYCKMECLSLFRVISIQLKLLQVLLKNVSIFDICCAAATKRFRAVFAKHSFQRVQTPFFSGNVAEKYNNSARIQQRPLCSICFVFMVMIFSCKLVLLYEGIVLYVLALCFVNSKLILPFWLFQFYFKIFIGHSVFFLKLLLFIQSAERNT